MLVRSTEKSNSISAMNQSSRPENGEFFSSLREARRYCFVSSGLVLSDARLKQVTLSCGWQAIPMLPQFGNGPVPRLQLRQPSVHLVQVLSTWP
jgi:hypothetical protein